MFLVVNGTNMKASEVIFFFSQKTAYDVRISVWSSDVCSSELLGTQEVRAYMMLLFIENSDLTDDTKEKIRAGVCAQLRQTWQGKRVDRAFVQSLHDSFPDELVGKLDTADRLAPLMIGATGISGNPRLIKRFLNALAIRMTISKAQGVGVEDRKSTRLHSSH